MYVTAIVLAAGKGLRLKAPISKPLIAVNSKPLIIYCLNTLSNHPYIKDIIVVVNPKNLKDIRHKIRQYRIGKIKDIVLGGQLRQDSVMNGLKAIDSRTELVLIHDAVRPFIDKEMISSAIKAAKICGAAIVAVPVKATIKKIKNLPTKESGSRHLVGKKSKINPSTTLRIDGERDSSLRSESSSSPERSEGRSRTIKMVEKTIDRNGLWEIQTPQVFKKDLILKAYKKFGNMGVTDDASLVEKLGRQVKVVMGSYFNIKITTPEDLVLAKVIAKKLPHSAG